MEAYPLARRLCFLLPRYCLSCVNACVSNIIFERILSARKTLKHKFALVVVCSCRVLLLPMSRLLMRLCHPLCFKYGIQVLQTMYALSSPGQNSSTLLYINKCFLFFQAAASGSVLLLQNLISDIFVVTVENCSFVSNTADLSGNYLIIIVCI